jgi:hypothetical protein
VVFYKFIEYVSNIFVLMPDGGLLKYFKHIKKFIYFLTVATCFGVLFSQFIIIIIIIIKILSGNV